jgi:aldehyde dehydrogenase (NAD+)
MIFWSHHAGVHFQNVDEAIAQINGRKPLFYISIVKATKNINHILSNTRAGGGCINHSAVHFFNTNLPWRIQ